MKLIQSFILLLLLAPNLIADGSAKEIPKTHFIFVDSKTGTKVSFDSKVDEIIGKLGQPKESVESLYKRNFRKLSWAGFDVYTLPRNNIIIVIIVKDASIATVDGLRVGDQKDKLVKAYGKPQVERTGFVEYDYYDISEPWGLRFELNEKNLVQKIIMSRID